MCVGFRWPRPEFTALSSLPVEATFRQMGGAPMTSERLSCRDTLGSGNCFFTQKRGCLSFSPVFSFSPFLSSLPRPQSFSFQLFYFLFPVSCALHRDSERKAVGALRRTPTALGVCLGKPWQESLWNP